MSWLKVSLDGTDVQPGNCQTQHWPPRTPPRRFGYIEKPAREPRRVQMAAMHGALALSGPLPLPPAFHSTKRCVSAQQRRFDNDAQFRIDTARDAPYTKVRMSAGCNGPFRRKPEDHRRSLADLALNGEVAAVQFDQLLGQGQTQPRAFMGHGMAGADLTERFED